jgi:hypothetical protein
MGNAHLLVQSSATDVGTLAFLGLAVLGFLYSLISIRRSSPSDRIADLIRQRDEARADLEACERRVRALERSIEKLGNGGGQ